MSSRLSSLSLPTVPKSVARASLIKFRAALHTSRKVKQIQTIPTIPTVRPAPKLFQPSLSLQPIRHFATASDSGDWMLRAKRYTKTAVGKVRMASIHSAGTDEVHDVPMAVIIRPFKLEVSEPKVESLMKTLDAYDTEDLVPPIDILWIQGSEGGNYYYSFGGCHRYEAHRRLQRATIRGKLIQSTIADLKCYLGASTPDLK